MPTVSHRLHVLVTLVVVGVTLACAAVSSAATAVHRPGGITIPTPMMMPPIITAMQSAGSPGIPGYDDERCQCLLGDEHPIVNRGREVAGR